jgi:hypothetical protein
MHLDCGGIDLDWLFPPAFSLKNFAIRPDQGPPLSDNPFRGSWQRRIPTGCLRWSSAAPAMDAGDWVNDKLLQWFDTSRLWSTRREHSETRAAASCAGLAI